MVKPGPCAMNRGIKIIPDLSPRAWRCSGLCSPCPPALLPTPPKSPPDGPPTANSRPHPRGTDTGYSGIFRRLTNLGAFIRGFPIMRTITPQTPFRTQRESWSPGYKWRNRRSRRANSLPCDTGKNQLSDPEILSPAWSVAVSWRYPPPGLKAHPLEESSMTTSEPLRPPNSLQPLEPPTCNSAGDNAWSCRRDGTLRTCFPGWTVSYWRTVTSQTLASPDSGLSVGHLGSRCHPYGADSSTDPCSSVRDKSISHFLLS